MAAAHNKGAIGPKLRAAIRYLLEVKDDLEEAAKHAGISSTFRLREALKRPNVRAYHAAEKKALLDVYCSGNPGALRQIRDDADGNQMARVQAIRTLEQLGDDDDQRRRRTEPITPGLVVVINSGPDRRVIEHGGPAMPAIEHRVGEGERR